MRLVDELMPMSVMVSDMQEVVFLGNKRWAEEGDKLSLRPDFMNYNIDIYQGGMMIGIAPIEEMNSIRSANRVYAGWIEGIAGIRTVGVDVVWA